MQRTKLAHNFREGLSNVSTLAEYLAYFTCRKFLWQPSITMGVYVLYSSK